MDVAKLSSSAQITKSDAEDQYSMMLENKRRHKERMKLVLNQIKVAANNKIILSGQNGEELLKFFKESTELVYRE